MAPQAAGGSAPAKMGTLTPSYAVLSGIVRSSWAVLLFLALPLGGVTCVSRKHCSGALGPWRYILGAGQRIGRRRPYIVALPFLLGLLISVSEVYVSGGGG